MPTADTPHDPSNDLSDDEELLVQQRVRYFVSRHRLPPAIAFDDLLQECQVHWWRQRQRWDPRRGAARATFLRRVVDNKLQDLWRRWLSDAPPDERSVLSLNVPGGEDLPEIVARLSDGTEVEADVLAALERQRLLTHLTPLQRLLAEGLERDHSLAEMSRQLGVPHSTLRGDLKRIQSIFRQVLSAEDAP